MEILKGDSEIEKESCVRGICPSLVYRFPLIPYQLEGQTDRRTSVSCPAGSFLFHASLSTADSGLQS